MNHRADHIVPRNAGHMNVVYDVVCPAVAGWAKEGLGEDGGNRRGWYLKGAGMSLRHPTVTEPFSAAMISAASIAGGKSVNQDACGWRLVGKSGGAGARIIAVADGVSGSLYSEFGAVLATLAVLRAGEKWGGEGCEFTDLVLNGLTECRLQMSQVADRIVSALERVVTGAAPQMDPKGVEEARRHLDILSQEGAEPLCTTVLAIAVCGMQVAGLSVGNGGIYRRKGEVVEPVWWRVDSDDIGEYVGSNTTPQKATFSFVDTWGRAESGVLGLATDGVGSFSRFVPVHLRRESWPKTELLLEEVLSDMKKRGVSSDLVDNLTLAEVGMKVDDKMGGLSHGA